MQIIFISSFCLLGVTVYAQQVNTSPATNNNGNVVESNKVEISNEEIELMADTVAVESIEAVEQKGANKSRKLPLGKAKKESSIGFEQNERLEESPVMEEQELEESEMDGKTKDLQPVEMEVLDEAMPPAPTSLSAPGASYTYSMDANGYKMASDDFVKGDYSSSNQRFQRNPTQAQQVQMDQAVGYFEDVAPQSFEYNYFKYVAGNHDVNLVDNLVKAEEIRPDNSDVHAQMVAFHVIMEDSANALLYLDKLIDDERLTQSVLDYSEDVLLSVAENGTLITHGFDDGYGAYYVQNAQGIRTDVTLISLDLMQSATYRSNLEGQGYKLPDTNLIDVSYLKEFCADNEDKNIGISLTTPKEYFIPIQDKLYVVGLIFAYESEEYNNFYRNDYLWNEELTKKNISAPKDDKGKQLSSNYLPMMLMLQNAYHESGEVEKAEELDAVSDQVGAQCRKYEKVKEVKGSY